MSTLKDLTGRRFGAWKVIKLARAGTRESPHAHWLCRCKCGVQKMVRGDTLRQGRSLSCGTCLYVAEAA